jgi:hypothetical protein
MGGNRGTNTEGIQPLTIEVVVDVDAVEYPELRVRDDVVVVIDLIESIFILAEKTTERGRK